MECPKCEEKAIVADTENYRYNPGEPLTQIRVYVCTNMECLHAFTYRNTFLSAAERRDAKKFIKRYRKQEEDRRKRQSQLEFEEKP